VATKKRPPRAVENKTSVTTPEVPFAEPGEPIVLPEEHGTIEIGEYSIEVGNLQKIMFPDLGLTKRDVLQYYVDIAPTLVPHLRDRPVVMVRWLGGIAAKSFYNKRAPRKTPGCVRQCVIDHGNGNIINFAMVQDTGSLLWIINLGCIDLHPWYGRHIEVNTPDFLHFDLDPGDADFEQVRESALAVRDALEARGMACHAKTSGSSGIHIYVPIVHGPKQKQVWQLAKDTAIAIADQHPALMTAAYRKKDRPPGRVLIDYNQNRWGATLASVYAIRPVPEATVSAPVTWEEVDAGFALTDFHIGNMRQRIDSVGDLWAPTLASNLPRFTVPTVPV
jgi:bifunctional non-homologous end joining protein LigD